MDEPEFVADRPSSVAHELQLGGAEADGGQEAAIAEIERLEGEFRVAEKSPNSPVVEVRLPFTSVTDAGLEYLKGLTDLEILDLSGRQITDAGLEHLKALTSLGTLNISNTGVTDAGLEHLKGLTRLESLWLGGSQVTEEGVQKLQQALPNCEIVHCPLPSP